MKIVCNICNVRYVHFHFICTRNKSRTRTGAVETGQERRESVLFVFFPIWLLCVIDRAKMKHFYLFWNPFYGCKVLLGESLLLHLLMFFIDNNLFLMCNNVEEY